MKRAFQEARLENAKKARAEGTTPALRFIGVCVCVSTSNQHVHAVCRCSRSCCTRCNDRATQLPGLAAFCLQFL